MTIETQPDSHRLQSEPYGPGISLGQSRAGPYSARIWKNRTMNEHLRPMAYRMVKGVKNLKLSIPYDVPRMDWEEILVFIDAFAELGGYPPSSVARLPDMLGITRDSEDVWTINGPTRIGHHEVDIYGMMYQDEAARRGGQGDDWARGFGEDAEEAFEDALEQLAQSETDWDIGEADHWPDKPVPGAYETVTDWYNSFALENGIDPDDPDQEEDYQDLIERILEDNRLVFLVIVSLWLPEEEPYDEDDEDE